MDITINERLKQFVEEEKISVPELYKKIGIHRSIWSGWMNQGKAISVEKLVALFKALPDLNTRWLLTGEGEMKLTDTGEKIRKIRNADIECAECNSKEKEIGALRMAINAKDELLEMYRKHNNASNIT
ncbi:MAG TPA: helix-turn-helix transcriptional regulator [Draconibacterium sp.]|nr:helix-turn-helix transcriptional regulator [Draconibacterium sp.]